MTIDDVDGICTETGCGIPIVDGEPLCNHIQEENRIQEFELDMYFPEKPKNFEVESVRNFKENMITPKIMPRQDGKSLKGLRGDHVLVDEASMGDFNKLSKDASKADVLDALLVQKAAKAISEFGKAAQESSPKPKAPKKKPSAPVRNTAFRDHEGLKALQRELNRKK